MSRRPLYRRPGELARRTAGNLAEYVCKAYGVASATAVVIGSGETAKEKAVDALTTVPDLLRTYHQAQYIATHSEEINKGLDYVRQHAPTAESLEQTIARTQTALERVDTLFNHLAAARDNIFSWTWQPGETYEHLRQATELLPSFVETVRGLRTSARTVSDLLQHLQNVDFDPFYRATLNAADNLSKDEATATLGVAGAAFAASYGLGMLVGRYWARRGLQGFVSRRVQNWGARHWPQWYEENTPEVLGPHVYAAAERHFEKRFRAKYDIPARPNSGADERSGPQP